MYTKQDFTKFQKHIFMQYRTGFFYNSNSDNMRFPKPDNGIIFINMSIPHPCKAWAVTVVFT